MFSLFSFIIRFGDGPEHKLQLRAAIPSPRRYKGNNK